MRTVRLAEDVVPVSDFKARAADYDRLPLDVIGCHDRIEELERELAKARKHVSELCKWLNAQGTPPE